MKIPVFSNNSIRPPIQGTPPYGAGVYCMDVLLMLLYHLSLNSEYPLDETARKKYAGVWI